jgi:hypothetical protein
MTTEKGLFGQTNVTFKAVTERGTKSSDAIAFNQGKNMSLLAEAAREVSASVLEGDVSPNDKCLMGLREADRLISSASIGDIGATVDAFRMFSAAFKDNQHAELKEQHANLGKQSASNQLSSEAKAAAAEYGSLVTDFSIKYNKAIDKFLSNSTYPLEAELNPAERESKIAERRSGLERLKLPGSLNARDYL